ncbi:MAG: hypothetical protein CVU55_02525 [Deltaproteobacteria bacterium HGW-Deltaproteobacteria-13]|jgi:hypothetical protein|nr:MAG: hypothetical protein CVU55_02525 [Deltaproteobacteria bacterium HGW-Deltaproteobacteria-13]
MQEALRIDIKQILGFIADEGMTPSALSPFYAEEPSVSKGSKLNAASMPLVKVVCEPAAFVSARIISAEGVVVTRIYADKSGTMTVRHWLDKDGLHNFRQVQEKDIADEAVLRLMLDIPPARLDFDTEMTEASFCAWLGLIDCWRERTLLSLIDRKPGGKFSFTVEEMYAAFRRSISSSDLRWLTPLVKELYPGNLDVSPSLFKEGVQSTIPKFAQMGKSGIKLTLLGEELCSSLSAPLAAVKLSVCTIKDNAIWEENIIGLRGMGIYCTLENTGEDNGKIILKNSSGPMIELYLHSKLAEALTLRRQSEAKKSVKESAHAAQPISTEPAMINDQKPAMKFCPECGKALKTGAKFCAECGKKI